MSTLFNLQHLNQQLNTCMLPDRQALRRKARELADLSKQQDEKSRQKTPRLQAEITQKLRVSQARFAARLLTLPKPEYPADLPVAAKKEEIAAAIQKHQVVIVCGETGSGKTTQLPKICLELGRGVAGLIGHTQPRRIAARSVASRIAQELNSPLGQAVGYKVRFNDKLSESSHIKLMTDGILLAETQGDKFLNAYDTIIIDEAHERSLNIDFLLGYLKQLLPRRPDLKVIVTSATIDADRFAKHFNGATVIEVSGRTYPVEVRYRPLGHSGFRAKADSLKEPGAGTDAQFDLDDETELIPGNLLGIPRKAKTEARWLEEDDEEEAIEEAILDAADDLLRQGDGDILVFLPGEREIRDVADHLRKYQGRSAKLKHIEVLPLFARLSIEDQNKIFQQKIFKSHSVRRIVLATNVAETSLTVPGIKYVIDAGLARVNRYSPRAKVEQLQIEKISQAAAKQRAGRCGRVSSGICVRLYSEEDFNNRPPFTEPEILRSSLASVILRMAALKLGDVAEFPFIEAPSSRLITDGYLLLQELGAVDAQRNITETGLQLARLPLDPRIGRMILAAKKEACLKETLIIASVLSIQDPRERPMDKREAADNAHAKFSGEGSDFMTYLKLWDWFEHALKNKKSNKELLNQCHANFLSFLRLKEWRELHQQLVEIVEEMAFKFNDMPANDEQVHKALLAGLLGNIGFKDGENESYAGARGIRFYIAPGSCLKKTRPKWVMAAELVDTTKLYARCVAKIEPDWIEPLARGLTQSTYTDPRWDRKLAQVVAWEKVTLYGLTVVPQRRVHYGPINPEISREIFIREALANMNFETKAAFYEHNRHMIAEIEALEHKARRQDVLVDEQALFTFYDALIPAEITNGAGFEYWRKQAEALHPQLLYLTRDALMRHAAQEITEVQFPETLIMDGVALPLKYRFEPGHVLDGVTATVPLALLNQLNAIRAEWLVPGMLREKLTTMIKALPKAIRRECVPVPDFVTGFLEKMADNNASSFPRRRESISGDTLENNLDSRLRGNDDKEVLPLLATLAAYVQQLTGLNLSTDEFSLESLPDHLLMNFQVIDEQSRELGMSRNWQQLKDQLGQAAKLTFRDHSPDIEKTGLKQWSFGDLPETLTFSRDGHQLTGYPALEDQDDSVAIKLFDTQVEAQMAHRAGVCRLMRFELKEQMKQLEKNLPNFNQYALLLRNVINPDTLKEDLLTGIADRAFIGEDDLPRTNEAFMKLKARARTRLPAVTEAMCRMLNAIAQEFNLLTAQQVKLPAKMNRLKTDVEKQMADLVYPHFLSQTPWEYLQHLPRYLKALRLRMDKQPSNPERDGKHAASVSQLWQNWQTKLEQQRKQDSVSSALVDFRWLIEELRVSLFAQELKTPFPVSIKRLEKILADLSR